MFEFSHSFLAIFSQFVIAQAYLIISKTFKKRYLLIAQFPDAKKATHSHLLKDIFVRDDVGY